MSDIAIRVDGLSKQYRLGEVGTGTLSHDLNRWWHKIRGKEDPYASVGDVNVRNVEGNSDYVWALKDIKFDVKKGEVIGIIGKNGAGKSTLLKILSKVTGPTVGEISIQGRIASLLEVGTGFHHELTGRENIYLNGAILGMTKAEVTRKLDEIVDFSGVAKYLDTPVKRYSTGMMVRLGFAVAAHLEPEILVVDEVLAVGDAEFQKKAIGKMQDVSKGDGRTILFVSHNMDSIRQLCPTCIHLKDGQLVRMGPTNGIVDEYLSVNAQCDDAYWEESSETMDQQKPNPYFELKKFGIYDEDGQLITNHIGPDQKYIVIKMEGVTQEVDGRFSMGLIVRNSSQHTIISNYHNDMYPKDKITLEKGINKLEFKLDVSQLNQDDYYVHFNSGLWGIRMIYHAEDNPILLKFTLAGIRGDSTYMPEKRPSILCPYIKWKLV